jgi:type II secretory pathway pseudopilin PulG
MRYKSLLVACPGFRKNSRGRRATTLVELLAVTTLVAILLSIVVTLAVRLRQWDRQVRNHSQHADQLADLAEAIRVDVRRATSVTLPEKNVIAIAGPDSREARYELQRGGCRRTIKTPGESSARTESFAIGPAVAWKLESAAPGRWPAYTITLEHSDIDNATSRSAPFFVYASLGGDLP